MYNYNESTVIIVKLIAS